MLHHCEILKNTFEQVTHLVINLKIFNILLHSEMLPSLDIRHRIAGVSFAFVLAVFVVVSTLSKSRSLARLTVRRMSRQK